MKPVMTRLTLFALTWFAAPLAAAGEPWRVPDFTAVFEARVGIARGETVLSLARRDDGRFVVESHTRLTGLVSLFKRGEIFEYCEFDFVDGEVLPTVFVREDAVSSENRDVRVDYDWAAGKAAVTHDGATREIDVEPGVTNTLLMQIALMQAISSGERRPWFDAVGHKGRLRFEVRYEGEEPVPDATDGQTALRYSHSRVASDIRTTFWAVPSLAHLPARAEIVKEGRLKGRLALAGYSPVATPARSAAAD